MKIYSVWVVRKQIDKSNIAYPISQNIVSWWMVEAIFKYVAYKKLYYINWHEAPEVVQSWNEYLKQNFKDWQEAVCWVHLTLFQYKTMILKDGVKQDEFKKLITSKLYHYANKTNGKLMVELNVQNTSNLPLHVKEGLSVRNINKKELVVFGKDKCIFHRSHLNNPTWYIDKKSSIRIKEMRKGIMVSHFSSRKFGFGLEMNKENFKKVNKKMEEKDFMEHKVAIYLNGNARKPELNKNALLCLIEHRKGKDGYWNFNHMLL